METVFVSIDAAQRQTDEILDTYRRCCCISLISEAALLPHLVFRSAPRSVNINHPSPSISRYLDSADPSRPNRNQFKNSCTSSLGDGMTSRRHEIHYACAQEFMALEICKCIRILGEIFRTIAWNVFNHFRPETTKNEEVNANKHCGRENMSSVWIHQKQL